MQAYPYAVRLFGLGILLALFSGLVGWLNLQWAARYYFVSAEAVLEGAPQNPRPKSINVTRRVAIVLAISSAACLSLGAILIAAS
jgi:hypothetical protein